MVNLFETAAAWLREGKPFVLATIVSTEGSSAGKPGARALIDEGGTIVQGWVGGGCADQTIATEAVAALRAEKPRLIGVDLNDEVLGAGLPCGGSMQVFLEPYPRPPTALVAGHGRVAEEITRLAGEAGFRVVADDLDPAKASLDYVAYLLVATQHKNDEVLLERALRLPSCRYVGLLASRHRTDLVKDKLRQRGCSEASLARLRAPAGLFFGGIGPTEIALAIVAEMVAVRRGARVGAVSCQST
jgi:xanthine dehydrogenase accessory factor